MRTLLLLRHAKASREDPALGDFDRPLTPRGEKSARRIGHYLRDNTGAPDLVLCSAALRTRQTLAAVAASLGPDVTIRFLKGLYLATPSRLMAAIRRTPDEIGSLLVIGHNPGIATLATDLADGGDPVLRRRMAEKFPAGALADVRLDIARWAEIAPGVGRLRDFVVPRDLRS